MNFIKSIYLLFINFYKKIFQFSGPGLLIAVGYMDPGNWATDIIGGSKFGYQLLSIILITNFFAIFLQYLSIKLGIVIEKDLAQICKDNYSSYINIILWILCEISIIACDVSEIIGTALALNLLFNLPIYIGVIITALNVFIITFFQNKNFKYIEIIVGVFMLIIFICFIIEIIILKPNINSILFGFIPNYKIIYNTNMLYISIGILGATVMPHNLYLHSNIIQTRKYQRNINGKKIAIKYATIDIIISLFLAFFINASILIIAAEAFYNTGYTNVNNITDAYKLLSYIIKSPLSGLLFAIALFASGQNSTITGTIAGQIIMEGFINFKLNPYIRRIITRLAAIIPAVIMIIIYGKNKISELIIISQIIISIQLIFAIIPLITITNNVKKMGYFVNNLFIKFLSWIISIIIILLNLYLIYCMIVF